MVKHQLNIGIKYQLNIRQYWFISRQELEGWFYNGGWKIFKGSSHSWQRGTNPPTLWRPHLYCLPPPFFQILSTLTPTPTTSLSPAIPATTVFSVVLFLWLNEWLCHIWCAVFINYNMDVHMLSLGTLVQEGPWCVFYATRHQVYTELWHMCFFTGTLIYFPRSLFF